VEKRLLGESGLNVSVLGLGCWPLGGGLGWENQDERDSLATIHAALERGINFFDTAEGYNEGHSEELLGKALHGRRDRALIATKILPVNADPATLRAHCEASLRRLQTDYVDLYQVHWPITDCSVEEAFAALRALQAEGKVRAIGVSNHGPQQLAQVLTTGTPVTSNQICYNLLCRAVETGIMPLCREHNIGLITYMALMQGLLTGKYATADDVPPFRARTRHFSRTRPGTRHGEEGAEAETFQALARIRCVAEGLGVSMAHLAVAWIIVRSGICCVLVGSRTPAQLGDNMAAAQLKLSPEIIAELEQATEVLRLKLGPNADYWQGGEQTRVR
jgi:aryl-alcohol dehydrogenase-like predicted oxidoreductase